MTGAAAEDRTATAVVLTPTLRQSTRRGAFWVIAVVAAILIAIGSVLVNGAATDLPRLSADSAAPDGARAVVEVLRQQGVEVIATDSLESTEQAIGDPDTTTVLVYDPDGWLDQSKRARLPRLADELVLLEPGFSSLQELAPGVSSAGNPDDDPLEATCSFAPVEAAGSVSPGGVGYRVDEDLLEGSPEVEECLRSDSDDDGADAFSLIRLRDGARAVTVVGATEALTNGVILQEGNAAFALGLLGSRDTLVWYFPSAADEVLEGESIPTTPRWFTPVAVLLMVTVIAAGIWRGRRFGPLIVENLPVVVRASETMEGRARLYQRSNARLRALDSLRIGAISRLARRCGLGSAATVEEVVAAVAALVGADRRDIRALLVDGEPGTDAELVAASDRLRDLESAVGKATQP